MVNFKLLSRDPTGIADPQVSTILSLHDSFRENDRGIAAVLAT